MREALRTIEGDGILLQAARFYAGEIDAAGFFEKMKDRDANSKTHGYYFLAMDALLKFRSEPEFAEEHRANAIDYLEKCIENGSPLWGRVVHAKEELARLQKAGAVSAKH